MFRFCCYSPPPDKIFSQTTDMLVLFRSFYRAGAGFKARARSCKYLCIVLYNSLPYCTCFEIGDFFIMYWLTE